MHVQVTCLAPLRHYSRSSHEGASVEEGLDTYCMASAGVTALSLLDLFASRPVLSTMVLCSKSLCMLARKRISDICVDVYICSRQTDEIEEAHGSCISRK